MSQRQLCPRTPTFQPAKMLQDARLSAMTGRTAAAWCGRDRQQRAASSQSLGKRNRKTLPRQSVSRCL